VLTGAVFFLTDSSWIASSFMRALDLFVYT